VIIGRKYKMEINKKEGFVSYVLVSDVSDTGLLSYYTGYYKFSNPFNTNDYTKAMKIPFKDEAENLCKELNIHNKVFTYHVEEHAYM